MTTPFEIMSTIAALAHPSDALIYDFVEGNLSAKNADLIRDHLRQCRKCRELAELFGPEQQTEQSAEIVALPIHVSAGVETRSDPARQSLSRRTARKQVGYVPDRLAAADRRSSGTPPDAQHLEPIFGMTDGNVTLNFCDFDGADSVVVDGAEDQPAQVMLGDKFFEVGAGTPGRPRLVEGLTRQRITLFIAGGQGVFKIIYK